jgi:hypothetical protein
LGVGFLGVLQKEKDYTLGDFQRLLSLEEEFLYSELYLEDSLYSNWIGYIMPNSSGSLFIE